MKRLSRWLMGVFVAAMLLAPVGVQAASSFSGLNLEHLDRVLSFRYLCEQGDCGDEVLNAKVRLQELGYYRDTATFGNDFNETMVQRVKLFQENNRLEVTGRIDDATAIKLTKDISTLVPGEYYKGYWAEPDVALIIPENTYGQWNEKSGNRFNFRIEVKNISQTRTIKAIEFYVYTKDIWGDMLISKSYPDRYTVETTFAPGKMGYTGYMTIEDRTQTQEVYIAIHRVRYSDGTTAVVETPEYYCWEINW